MMRSIITRLLDTSGLGKESGTEGPDSSEPMMVTLAKSIDSIVETGYISSQPYRSLVTNLKFTKPKWLVQKMIGVSVFLCSAWHAQPTGLKFVFYAIKLYHVRAFCDSHPNLPYRQKDLVGFKCR